MIVDSGADYTLLPFSKAKDLGVDLEKECRRYTTLGIGGAETVYLSKRKLPVKIGEWKKKISIAVLIALSLFSTLYHN